MLRHRLLVVLLCLVLIPCAPRIARTASNPTSVTLHWTAPGDDGNIGKATRYDLRFSTVPLTEANFALAATVSGMPAPKPAGSPESFLVTNLNPNFTYYLAIKSIDDRANASKISNVVVVTSQTTDVDLTAGPTWLSPAWPNPSRQSARLSYSLSQAGPIQVDAFDVAGKHVRSVESGWRRAGSGDLSWDLRDDAGHEVPSGIYLVRARLDARVLTSRVCVIH